MNNLKNSVIHVGNVVQSIHIIQEK